MPRLATLSPRVTPTTCEIEMRLLYTGGGVARWVDEAEEKLQAFRSDSGYWYLKYEPMTPPNRIVVEDLGVTLLMNSQVGWRNAKSVIEHASDVDLGPLPDHPLEETTEKERQQIAELIGKVASWPGFGSSTATKLLHKKRPDLIPILDNLAIFGAYLNPYWGPDHPASDATVKDVSRIRIALDQIFDDLTRAENRDALKSLTALEPGHSAIDVLDAVWWIYFRQIEPVRRKVP